MSYWLECGIRIDNPNGRSLRRAVDELLKGEDYSLFKAAEGYYKLTARIEYEASLRFISQLQETMKPETGEIDITNMRIPLN